MWCCSLQFWHNKVIKQMGESTNLETAYNMLNSLTAPTAYYSRYTFN